MKNKMQTVTIDLGERSYPIYIGTGLLSDSGLIRKHIQGQQVLVVSNDTVAPLYQAKMQSALGDDLDARFVILPDGESHKNLTVLNTIYDALLAARFDRNCCLVALGGGVVGDMAGYAAASYQRGVDFIQIPTTLLAQVDSSVGGKTGVNHALGKNMIGAFHQPQCVIADTDTLSTLADAELRAGLAEVIKHGLILDSDLFDWLESNLAALLQRDPAALAHVIRRSCEIKSAVVTQDEHELGQRALLNLGHTFGHAIETTLGYGKWLHGEAVAAGMAMAMDLSCRLGWMPDEHRVRALKLITAAGLPVAPPQDITPEQFLDCMLRDKKTRNGTLRLVLLNAIGKSIVTHDFDEAALGTTLAEFHKPA